MSTPSDQALPDGTFPEHVVAAVVGHMNDDHAADTATIARAFGGLPMVDAASVLDVDAHGMEIAVDAAGITQTVRVRFAVPVRDRNGLREEITQLFHAAVARLEGREGGVG